ncbi:hypothetical protein AAG570_014070 [Ranatra chinensis]|uniref:DUF7666 domain-containing protein n=1 Tax=Ranatra chinensis TaxID=642074 RepID=A0ABD0XS86_9HEMI
MDKRIGYKAFNQDKNGNLYCRDKVYKVSEIAEVTGKLELCKNGIHFCNNLADVNSYYSLKDDIICEIEILGDVLEGGDKSCTNRIKVLKILTGDEVRKLANTGYNNTGYHNTGGNNTGDSNTGDYNSGYHNSGYHNSGGSNTGDYNSGDHNSGYHNSGGGNTGDYNSGGRNTGDNNTGDSNTGDYNSGYHNSGNRNSGGSNTGDYNSGGRNTGDYNSGYHNTGDCNTGNYNTGNRNSGDYNTGYYNCGDYNTGDRNSGDYNTGYHNTGNCNTGFFNSKSTKINLFNKISTYTYDEFINSKYFRALSSADFCLTEWVTYTEAEKREDEQKNNIGGYLKSYTYKEACASWWEKLTYENRETIKQIPNFDPEIFEDITGIRV